MTAKLVKLQKMLARELEGKQNWSEHKIAYMKKRPKGYSQRNADNLTNTHWGRQVYTTRKERMRHR